MARPIHTIALAASLLVALVGCSVPVPAPTASAPSKSASPVPVARPSASPTAAPDAAAAGFTVPDTCEALLSTDLATSLAAQGMSSSQVQVWPDFAIGDPLPAYNFDGGPNGTVPITDYINCEWVGAGHKITIYLARVDPTNRDLVIGELALVDARLDRAAPVVISTFDGVIPGVGQSPSRYSVLRSESDLRVDIDPGGEATRKLAQSIADQVSAHVRAD